MRQVPYGRLVSVAIFLVAVFVVSSDDVTEYFKGLMGGGLLGALAYVAVLIAAVVLVPIAAFPLIPLASALFGPFVTGLLSIVGWTLGGVVAFLLARHLGRPVLRYFVPLERVDELEKRFSRTDAFMSLVLLRMIVPVDVLSYAVGLVTAIPLRTYALATAIGVAPFSFIFAYGGQALAERSFLALVGIAGLGGLLFFLVARHYRRLWHSSTNSR